MKRPQATGAGERGQAAVVVVIAAFVMFVVIVAALALLGGRAVDRTRAQSLADAAALGSVDRGRAAAVALVAVQGGRLESWAMSPDGATVTVVVRVGDASAVARATVAP